MRLSLMRLSLMLLAAITAPVAEAATRLPR